MLFSIRDGQIYITGTIFSLHPDSDLAQNCASYAVCYMQSEFTSIRRRYFVQPWCSWVWHYL